MSSLQLSAPLRCHLSRVAVLTGHKKPRLFHQRRGHQIPAVPPCLDALPRAFLAPSSRPLVGGLAPATPSRPTESHDCSPARLEGEFGILPAPVFHQPPALWSRTRRPYYSPSMPTIFN